MAQAQYSYTTNNGTITITGYYGPGGVVNIPSTIYGRSVTSIGGAFQLCTSLISVTIPNSVTSIGGVSFAYCTSLTSVMISTNVTSIGGSAFYYCPSLTTVMIPNSVTNIGNNAFDFCTSLTNIYFPGNAPNIGSSLFYDVNNATVYYLRGTTGWGPTFAGLPTAMVNSIDVQAPVLTITAPTNGQLWSNGVFTVTGTAGDNVAVASVFYSLNNAGWSNAVTANNWANWTAAVILSPGTNTLAAYAVDTSGNPSTGSNVSFDFVVTNQLQIRVNGLGTVSPNYSNAWLEIGKNYSITATAGTGFMFTNWMGGTSLPLGWLTNGTTVQFQMQSNLILQANLVDIQKPTLSITNLTAGQRVSNATFIVKGTANDNWMVSNVWCQIDGLGWNSATNINNWTNWSAGVTLLPGTNVVQAYAVDTSGNLSTTNTVNFDFVVTNQLRVSLTGLGSISPNYSNAWLEIGRNYSMAATPASGFNFTNWVVSTNGIGGTKTNGATVRFMMASNLTLQVNFVDVTKPTLTITAPTSGQHMTNALATVVGTASDNWKVVGVWYSLNGGTRNQPVTTNNWTNWMTTVELQNATNNIKAYALDLGGNFSTTNSVSFVSSNTFKLLLAFTTVQPLATNGLNFVLQVSPGLNGHVEVSTDLVDWVALTNFVGTNATLNFRDAAATNLNQRFYRAVTP